MIASADNTITQAEPRARKSCARDLHAVLEVGKDFSTWIKDRIEKYGFTEGEDFIVKLDSPDLAIQEDGFSPDLVKTSSQGGRPAIDYHLTLDMAKELAMIENNPKGREVRRYFIRVEKMARLFAQPLIPTDKKAARECWTTFRELVAENTEAGCQQFTKK